MENKITIMVLFLFSKNGSQIPGNFQERNTTARDVDECFGSCEPKARVFMMTLSNTKPKNQTNISRYSLPKFASDGSDYELDSLRVMLAALYRHLRQNDSKIFIAKDQEFVKCKHVLERKARALRKKGYRKRPNATKALTIQDEEQLWKNRLLGKNNPKSLLYTLWHQLCSISFILVFEVAKSTMECLFCRRFHFQQSKHRVHNIQRKPN